MHRYISLFLLIGLVWGQKEYNINHLVEQNGIYKKKFSDEIVNGKVYAMIGELKAPLGKMVKGRKEGVWSDWYENGTLKTEFNYVNGIQKGLSIGYNRNGYKTKYIDLIDQNNYAFYGLDELGELSGYNYIVKNGIKVSGQEEVFFPKAMILHYDNGSIVKREHFNSNRNVVKVDDCVNTDDCLSDREKRAKNTIYTDPELVWKNGFLDLSYYTKKYRGNNEVFFQLSNQGSYPYKSVWLNIRFYRAGNLIYDEKVQFLSLKAYGQVSESLVLLDEFDKIEVELLKYKDG